VFTALLFHRNANPVKTENLNLKSCFIKASLLQVSWTWFLKDPKVFLLMPCLLPAKFSNDENHISTTNTLIWNPHIQFHQHTPLLINSWPLQHTLELQSTLPSSGHNSMLAATLVWLPAYSFISKFPRLY